MGSPRARTARSGSPSSRSRRDRRRSRASIRPPALFRSSRCPRPSSGALQIVLGPDGNMWFTELGNTKIARITTPPWRRRPASPPRARTVGAPSARAWTGTHQATSFHVEYGPVGEAADIHRRSSRSGSAPASRRCSRRSPALTQLYELPGPIVVSNPTGSADAGSTSFITAAHRPHDQRRAGVGQALARGQEARPLQPSARPPVGTTFSLTLDQSATVKFAFQVTRHL